MALSTTKVTVLVPVLDSCLLQRLHFRARSRSLLTRLTYRLQVLHKEETLQ